MHASGLDPRRQMKRAVFLDRDGVINRSITRSHTQHGSPRSVGEMVLLPRVQEAVNLLKDAGLLVIVVTNQPEISRGVLALEDLESMHQYIWKDLAIDDLFVCVHDRGEGCQCRKPKPGMLLEAATKWEIDLQRSYLVGDRSSDIEAGLSVGCTTFLIGLPNPDIPSHFVADHLYDGAAKIASFFNG